MFEALTHAAFSLGLAPSDYHSMRQGLNEQHFNSYTSVKNGSMISFRQKNGQFFFFGAESKNCPRDRKSVATDGNHVEVKIRNQILKINVFFVQKCIIWMVFFFEVILIFTKYCKYQYHLLTYMEYLLMTLVICIIRNYNSIDE